MKPIEALYGSFRIGGTGQFASAEAWVGFAWEDLIRTARQELVLPAFGARLQEMGSYRNSPPKSQTFFPLSEI